MYNTTFFDEIAHGSMSSARVIVPILMEKLRPQSVLDVGCAEGAWLREFQNLGLSDCFGIDGAHVNTERLLIDKARFSATDLENGFKLGRKFDLVICLEVAEHLSASAANKFVNSLVAHGDCVLFSAAVPHQDGTGHINEQWIGYWVALFEVCGFVPIDCLRRRIWSDKRVCWWFAQNAVLFVRRSSSLASDSMEDLQNDGSSPLALVHPELLLHKQRCIERHEARARSIRWLSRRLLRELYNKVLR